MQESFDTISKHFLEQFVTLRLELYSPPLPPWEKVTPGSWWGPVRPSQLWRLLNLPRLPNLPRLLNLPLLLNLPRLLSLLSGWADNDGSPHRRGSRPDVDRGPLSWDRARPDGYRGPLSWDRARPDVDRGPLSWDRARPDVDRCPASPEKEDPSATAATSALYSAGPVVSDLHLF